MLGVVWMFDTLLLPPVRTIPLCKLRAVALEVAGSLTVVALVAACCSGHRRSTPRNGRRRRLPGQVVDVEVDCGLFHLIEVEGTIPMMHLLYELEFFREGIEQHIGASRWRTCSRGSSPPCHPTSAESRPW